MARTRRDRIVAGLGRDDLPGKLPGRICRSCTQLAGVSGTVITRVSGDGHVVVWGAGASARRVGDAQASVGQGPAIDAFTTRAPVLAPSREAVTLRWPRLVDVLAPVVVQAVFCFPLQVGAARLGALGLYRDTPGPLTGDELANSLVCADLAIEALLAGPDHAFGTAGWESAGTHARVAEATGRVMVQLRVSATVALTRLCAHAGATGVPVAQVADQVNRDRLRLPEDPS